MITGAQIYHQCCKKARIIGQRKVRALMRGEIDSTGECVMDMERRFIIERLDALLAECTP